MAETKAGERMLVYVSSPTMKRGRVRRFNEQLRAIGAEPTVDWAVAASSLRGTDEEEHDHGRAIQEAIQRSDVFVLLSGWANVGSGAHTELGLALGRVPHVIVVCQRKARGVMALADAMLDSKIDALDHLHQRLHGQPLPEDLRAQWIRDDRERRSANEAQGTTRTDSATTPAPVVVTPPVAPPQPRVIPSFSPDSADMQRAIGGTMKATLVGRHTSSPEVFDDYVTLRVPGRAASLSLPKGVPSPKTADEYLLLVSRKQWRAIEPILQADRQDRFIADGVPVVEGNTLVLHVSGLTTIGMQRKKTEATAVTR